MSGAYIRGISIQGAYTPHQQFLKTQLVLHSRSGRVLLLQINDNNLFHKLLSFVSQIVVFFVDVVLKGNTI